jgi:hypothetical protein
MGLKDLRLPTSRVDIPGEEEQFFEVRGLSFVDMRTLLVKHSSELSRLFDLVANGNGADPLSIASAAAAAGQFLNESPALAAEVIAMATGEEGVFEQVLMLPFPVQVDALTKIGKLTFATEDSAKKFLQTVRSLIGMFKESQKS